MPDNAAVGTTMSIEQCMLDANGGLEQTDAAIERAKAKLREIDEKIEQMRQSRANPVFAEIASELDGHSLTGATIITQLTVRSHQLISNLTRLRPRGRR
jgi:DNA repair ATPase RecN